MKTQIIWLNGNKSYSVLWGIEGAGGGGLGPKTANIDIFINLDDLPEYSHTTEVDKHDNGYIRQIG